MHTFDPNAASATDSGVFGLPYSVEESSLVLVPVPWEVTTSYKKGTAGGPAGILAASRQVDLFDVDLKEFYATGITMLDIPKDIVTMNASLRPKAEPIIAEGGMIKGNKALSATLKLINSGSRKLNAHVGATVRRLRKAGKIVGLVGGEHSTPFGAMEALLEEFPDMGILQIDAHCDLRKAYEGFEFSHASIMYNVLTKLPLKKLVQVGIRDFCKEESDMIRREKKRIVTFYDRDLAEWKAHGQRWSHVVKRIVRSLPKHVFISFDIDGLEPTLCPHTGTPVPGGLSFNEAVSLLKAVVESGRTIVGFDLNEVAPGGTTEWDCNVGSRMLFKLCGWTLRSWKKV